mmetsp:Transcript_107069/g.308040  ORF Transcript_107069/g.308040 Transcript_107069/m.308040 type:complete len:291 (-) Transcript_107069:626-1498(-)
MWSKHSAQGPSEGTESPSPFKTRKSCSTPQNLPSANSAAYKATKSSRLKVSEPRFSIAAMANRYSLPRPSSLLTRMRYCSTSARVSSSGEAALPRHRSKAALTAAKSAGVGTPSSDSIFESNVAAKIVGWPLSSPMHTSPASRKGPKSCRRTFEVIVFPAWPFSVGSPDSRNSGPTSPATRNSRTAVLPMEFRSPAKIMGVQEGSRPRRLASFAAADNASTAWRRRRSALGPAAKCAFKTKRTAPTRGPDRRRMAMTSVRSLCCADTCSHRSPFQKLAARIRPLLRRTPS